MYMHMNLFFSLVDLYRTAQYMTSVKLCDLFWKTARGKYIQCKCWRIDSGVKWGPRLICFTWRHNTLGRYLLDITQSKIGINKGECLYIYIYIYQRRQNRGGGAELGLSPSTFWQSYTYTIMITFFRLSRCLVSLAHPEFQFASDGTVY